MKILVRFISREITYVTVSLVDPVQWLASSDSADGRVLLHRFITPYFSPLIARPKKPDHNKQLQPWLAEQNDINKL